MLNKRQISDNFSRSAKHYEKIATFQKFLADELFINAKDLSPKNILDLGCGTGYLTRKLAQQFKDSNIVAVDIAPGMIKHAKAKNQNLNIWYVIHDCEKLPKLGTFDLIVSNASIQWMDLKKLLASIKKNISKDGVFIFHTFGPNNLKELKAAGFKRNKFPSKEEIIKIFKKHFKKVTIHRSVHIEKFKNIQSLVNYLKDLGANTPTLAGKTNIKKLKEVLRNSPTPFFATFEVYLGICS